MMHKALLVLLPLFALAVLAACAPKAQKVAIYHSAPTISEKTYYPGDGAELPLDQYPAINKTKAVIIALHGFNDYRNAYFFPASYWTARGITSYVYDQRGFGEAPEHGIWARTENLVADAARMVEAVKERHPGIPVYLMGESMGGAVTIASQTRPDAPKVDGIILSAPALWGDELMYDLYSMALWMSAHTLPGRKMTGDGLRIQATDNIDILRQMGRDPHVIKATRVDTVYGLVGLMDEARRAPPKLHTKTLLLYGKNDQIIPEFVIQNFQKQMKNKHVFIHYDSGWHMLLRDLQAENVWRDIADWVLGVELKASPTP